MIYFDHASTAFPKNKEVLQAFYEASQTYANAGRGGYDASIQASRLLYQTREEVKQFVDCPNGITVFTYGATHGLNIILQGLLTKSDHVICSTLEHQSVLRPLYQLQQKGLQLSMIPFDETGCIQIEKVKENWQLNTKAVICTLASNVLGTIQPIQKLAALVHKHGGILIVDAAQAIGHMPISMRELGIDILIFGGHKGLCTPRGIGAIVMTKTFDIVPLYVGGTGFATFDQQPPSFLPERLESGTMPIELIASLKKAIHIQKHQYWEYEKELTNYFLQKIGKLQGVFVVCKQYLYRVPIVSITIDGYTSEEVADMLYHSYEICVRGGMHCAPLLHEQLQTKTTGLIRFSFHYTNTKQEIDTAIHAIRQLVER